MDEIKKIAPELKFAGKTLKIIDFSLSLKKLKLARGVVSLLFKNKKRKGFTRKSVYIDENKSLRLCIFSKTASTTKNHRTSSVKMLAI